jgi:hypothetical protein
MQRYRSNFQSGVASGVINSTGQTSIAGSNWPTTIPSGQYLPVTLNPGYFGASNTSGPEIIYVTSVSGNVATVLRGQEGTSGALVSGTLPWISGPLVSDFTLLSGMVNGDFPVPTASGQILTAVGSGIVSPIWTLPGLTASTINASGTNQATASLVATQYTVVNGATATASGQASKTGVILPVATVPGQYFLVDNNSSNWLPVYPNGTQNIDSAGNSNPIWLAPNAYWEGVVESIGTNGNWASFIASLNSGAGINVAYGNGNITFSLATGNLPAGVTVPVTQINAGNLPSNVTISGGNVNSVIYTNYYSGPTNDPNGIYYYSGASGANFFAVISGSSFTPGQQMTYINNISNNAVTISGAGQTIFSTGAISAKPTLRTVGSVATAVYLGSNTWVVTGDIV